MSREEKILFVCGLGLGVAATQIVVIATLFSFPETSISISAV
jgi:hypothetical protein